MNGLEKETFLRVLRGAPLSVLIGLWVHGGMDQGQLRRRTHYEEKTVRDALVFLEDLHLVQRSHYRKWILANEFYQLPLARVGLSESAETAVSASAQIAESAETAVSASAQIAESAETAVSASSSDLIRSEEEEEDVDNIVVAHFSSSLHLLESIGLGGSDLERMAQYHTFEILGAWWYLLAGGWAEHPKAVLRSHLLQRRRTPHGFLDLAKWWLLASSVEHEELVEVVCGERRGMTVAGLSGGGLVAAREFYDVRKEFGL